MRTNCVKSIRCQFCEESSELKVLDSSSGLNRRSARRAILFADDVRTVLQDHKSINPHPQCTSFVISSSLSHSSRANSIDKHRWLSRTMASHPETKIDCSKVYVKRSSFATTEAEFDGAFAAVPIKKGALHCGGPSRVRRSIGYSTRSCDRSILDRRI